MGTSDLEAGGARRPLTGDQSRGCLLGGAVGDALGAPVEFLSWAAIRDRFGDDGIVDLAPAYGRVGAITDDTQMTLWTAEGVLRGLTRARERGGGDPLATLPGAYLRWLYTQDARLPGHFDETDRRHVVGDDRTPPGWLLGVRNLHARRAPGNTCLASLRSGLMGRRTDAINDSKGCGGVMRVAPFALVHDAGAEASFQHACDAAALTHSHPTGWMAAGAFAAVLVQLREGMRLEDSVRRVIGRLRIEQRHEETTRALEDALALYVRGTAPTPEEVESLGGGWVAEEALAIAVYAALVAGDDFARGVRIAVNHSGDSDSTGSMAGQLIGLQHGPHVIPGAWLAQLELRDEISTVADDLVVGWAPGEEWWTRYPGY